MNHTLPNVALIAGGYSGESEISVRSASVILKNIDSSKFNVFLISITREHWLCLYENQQFPVNKNDFSVEIDGKTLKFHTAFIMIHGTPGEDGVLQGYFDMIGIPYTTCNATVSALTFNKFFCNNVIRNFNLAKVAQSCRITSGFSYSDDEIINIVGLPCFVKPNAGGSSIGTTKVHKKEQLNEAIKVALKEDDEVLIEQFIKGREITCGVIYSRGELISFPLTEVKSKKEFFDFEAKYTPELAEEITPAPIEPDLALKIRTISEQYYKLLNCRGVVRFDYIVNESGIWFLEVNTIPGMSAQSIVPQQAKAYGWTYTELTTRLIEDSFFRFESH